MSGSTTPASPLTSAEAVDLRRFCGYSPFPKSPDAISAVVPRLTDEILAVVRTYLANLRLLEADLPGMRGGLNVDTAAVFKRNANEQSERNQLYRDQRRSLCLFLGIDTGPFLNTLIPGAFVV